MKNEIEEKYTVSPTMRVVDIILKEYMINEKGEKIELISPKKVRTVVLENDFMGLGHRNVKEEITKKTCDCLGLIHNSIVNGEIVL